MTKIEEFVKLITGRFDNKEQFDAMKKAGKTYPYAQHVNTVCNDKIKNLPADFKGMFIVEESYYENEGKVTTPNATYSYTVRRNKTVNVTGSLNIGLIL